MQLLEFPYKVHCLYVVKPYVSAQKGYQLDDIHAKYTYCVGITCHSQIHMQGGFYLVIKNVRVQLSFWSFIELNLEWMIYGLSHSMDDYHTEEGTARIWTYDLSNHLIVDLDTFIRLASITYSKEFLSCTPSCIYFNYVV